MASRKTDNPAPPEHFDDVARGFKLGWVTPVLGAGASLCGRPEFKEEEGWLDNYLPSSQELAAFLGKRFDCPASESADLLRVAQYIYAMRGGSGPLYETLHGLFDNDYSPSPVHNFLAQELRDLGTKKLLNKLPVILTTNYDDLMETALDNVGEPFDLVVYMAEGPHEGQFCHRQPDGTLEPIEKPDTRVDIDPAKQTVVLKIHGFVDRKYSQADSYVITEDHYIEYLTRTNLDGLLPPRVLSRLKNCHMLFLGYSLRDWNLRAILSRLYADRLKDWDWWAIQFNPDSLEHTLERKSWERRRVAIYDHPLDEYIQLLKARFDAMDLAG